MALIFPGIDPFLEAQGFWPDFHARAITYSCDLIADRLPESYLARIEERSHLVERSSRDVRLMRPDVIIERLPGSGAVDRGPAVLEVEPTTLPLLLMEEVRETYREIIHRPDQTLVAVIEWLSPDNKGRAWLRSISRQAECLARGVGPSDRDRFPGRR